MKENIKEKGITLIALVTTIVILLILAGVTLSMSLSQNGLFSRALDSRDRYEKSQLKEEIFVAIMDIQLEEASKGKDVTLDSLVNGQLASKLGDITSELGEPGIVGEYKDHNYTIDSNFNIEIGDRVDGIKPKINAEITTTGYVLEGNTVEIKVIASISEGKVSLEVPEDMKFSSSEEDGDQKKIYKYTVNKNGSYTIIAVGDGGRKATTTLKVEQILNKPQISITDNVGTEITVNVINKYPNDNAIKYTYYLNDNVKADKITENKYQITELEEAKSYQVKVALNYGEDILESEKLDVTTISVTPQIVLDGNFEITPLDYPILTKKGVFNCSMNIESGENRVVKIPNSETLKKVKNIVTYYSVNDEQWEEYTGEFTINYTGNTTIKAKREINSKTCENELILYKQYAFDRNKDCTDPSAIKIATYDGYEETFADCDNGNGSNERWILNVDEECWNGKIGIKFSSIYASKPGCYMGCMAMTDSEDQYLNNDVWYIVCLANNKDGDHSSPNWEYVTIPEGCVKLGFSDGSGDKTKFDIYEIKYNE